MRPGPLVVVVACSALLVASACSSSGDTADGPDSLDSIPVESILNGRVLPEGDEPTVLGPLGQTEAEFETDDGLVQIGGADVPEAVADSFPIPDSVEVQLSSQEGTQAGFSGVTDMTFDELVSFFEAELPAAGYELERSQFVDAVLVVYDFDGPDGSGQLVISSAPGGGRSVLATFSS
jgi:hypothetical protein